MESHQKEIKIKRGNHWTEYIIYENGSNYVFATFLSWDSNEQATHISVRSNFIKILKVHFCTILDQLEISFVEEGVTTQPFITKLNSCYINREEVILIDYKDDHDEYKNNEYECFKPSDGQPDVKKGNILVGG